MTMIAFATYGDRAEIITDSASYNQNGSAIGRTSKVLTIPHLDAAVATQGDSLFGVLAKSAVLQVAGQLATFDDVVAAMPRHLREIWAERREDWADASDSIIFLLGYSARSERFEAYLFATDRGDLEPSRVGAPWVTPCPWSFKPSLVDVKRLREWSRDAAAAAGEADQGHEAVQLWMTKPPMTAPATVDEWVDLAKQVREERALSGYATVYVAGDVFYTRIARGEATTRKVHTYDDEGDEFLQMIEGTQHPVAQLMPCWCESGKAFLDCHLAPQLDERCQCNMSDKTFRECCAVTPEQRAAIEGAG